MLSTTLSTVIVVPILALLSIPLIISAYLTTVFSLLALCIRLSVIYIELSSAIIGSYFTIPTSSHSLLTFTPSEPTTPYGASPSITSTVDHLTYASIPRTSLSSSTRRLTRPANRRRHGSSASLDDARFSRRGNFNTLAGSKSFSSFVSGDEHRDFEDMGGWRYSGAGASNKGLGLSSKPMPSPSTCDIAEERAWMSINQRLELPSYRRRLSLGESGMPDSLVRPVSPIRKRHHRRSATTSALPLPATRLKAPPLAPSNRSDSPSTISTPGTPEAQQAPRSEPGDVSPGPLEGHAGGPSTSGAD